MQQFPTITLQKTDLLFLEIASFCTIPGNVPFHLMR